MAAHGSAGQVAQLVEQRTENQNRLILGKSPKTPKKSTKRERIAFSSVCQN
jgi:hypothetical protein